MFRRFPGTVRSTYSIVPGTGKDEEGSVQSQEKTWNLPAYNSKLRMASHLTEKVDGGDSPSFSGQSPPATHYLQQSYVNSAEVMPAISMGEPSETISKDDVNENLSETLEWMNRTAPVHGSSYGSPLWQRRRRREQLKNCTIGVKICILVAFTIIAFVGYSQTTVVHGESMHTIAFSKMHPAGLDFLRDSRQLVLTQVKTTYPVQIEEDITITATLQVKGGDNIWRAMEGQNPWIITLYRHTFRHTFHHKWDFDNDVGGEMRLFLEAEGVPDPVAAIVRVQEMGPLGNLRVFFAGVILFAVFTSIAFELLHRTVAVFLGIFGILGLMGYLGERPHIDHVFGWVDVQTVVLLFGMMMIVGFLQSTGFFPWIAVYAFKVSRGDPAKALGFIVVFTAVLSALLDNVTTILLMTPVVIQICEIMKMDVRRAVILVVVFSNLGGMFTVIGDPPNVMIASTVPEVNFVSYFINILPVTFLCCISTGVLTTMVFWKKIKPSEEYQELGIRTASGMDSFSKQVKDLEKENQITNMPLLIRTLVVLGLVITFFCLDSITAIEMAWVPLYGTVLVVILSDMNDIEDVLLKVEWNTLLFFGGLSVFMEGISWLGFVRFFGDCIKSSVIGVDDSIRLPVAIGSLIVVSAVLSAGVDNVPYTATMIPVIENLAADADLNLPRFPLMLALALGTGLGGNGSLIAASSNVVACGIMDKAQKRISFVQFCSMGLPVMCLTVAVATVYSMCIFGVMRMYFIP